MIKRSYLKLFEAERSYQSGQAMLASVVFLVLLSVVIIEGFATPLTRELKTVRVMASSRQSYFAAESGVEDAIYRLKNNLFTPPASYSLTVGSANTEVEVTISGSNRLVTATGDNLNHNRLVAARVNTSEIGAEFFYGVQVSDGGLTMNNNSRINGNVYSNGNIIGGNGAIITGTASVAGGLGDPDTEWTLSTGDLKVGTYDGTVVTTVDSTGFVGWFPSVVLGADGFARIAYYDLSTDELNFARCLDEDCLSRNINVVDTSGDVGQYASLAFGTDGFARIAYYDVSSANLKFARCLDADCLTKSTTAIDSIGDKGQYASLALGADGFGRIAYYDDTGNDLEFARCTNADCTTSISTTVEASGDTGGRTSLALDSSGYAVISYLDNTNADLEYVRCTNVDCTTNTKTTIDSANIVSDDTSLALGADGFARIVYYDFTGRDLEFVRCTNAECTARNTATVDSAGDVGQYASLALGADGFGRIAYYDDTNTNLKFAKCGDADCSTPTLVTIDNDGVVGRYASLALGADGFARIAHYDDNDDDLRYLRCVSDPCSLSIRQTDLAQSFQPGISGALTGLRLYLRKVGSPADATVRVVSDSGGHPSTSNLATATLQADSLGTTYSWIALSLDSNPNLTAGTTYWIVIDAAHSTNDYYLWAVDSGAGYPNGHAESSPSWSVGPGNWSAAAGDLNFSVTIGGTNTRIENMIIGDATAGAAYANQFIDTTVHGAGCPNQYCVIDNPPREELPLSDGVIQDWREAAAVDEVINDNLLIDTSTTTGPIKIEGDLTIDIDTDETIILTGIVYATGNITMTCGNDSLISLDSDYGPNSGLIMADGIITIGNHCSFSGSGDPASYLMVLSAKDDNAGVVMDVNNNSAGVIYYASKGLINLKQNAAAKEATAYGITLEENAIITYESGLANINFTSGPGGSFQITSWQEVE